MKKILTLALAALLVMSLSLGLGNITLAEEDKDAPPIKEGGTLVVREAGDPMSFCPSAAADDNGYAMFQNMYNRLTKLDSSKQPVPDAAESWDISDDAKTITFHLKDNMKWWDGEALDAEDVKYTFDYIKEHPTCYFSSSMEIVDEIEIVDPLTVVFHMNTADVSFVARIGWYATFILPEHIYNNGEAWEDNEAAKTKPMGSGPFMFDSYEQGKHTILVKNPNYHDGAPHLDKLIFAIVPDDTTAVQAMFNGEIDTIAMVPDAFLDQMQADPNWRVDRDLYPSPWRYIFNLENEKVQDVAIRQAIARCVDRKEFSEKVTSGVMPPEWTAYPSIVEWAANTDYPYPDVDIEGARKILEDAGYEADEDGFYVRGLTIDCFEGQLVDMTKLLIANCAKAGIEIELIVSEFNAWAEKVVRHGDWIIEAQGGFMGPDPAALKSRFGKDSNSNFGSYINDDFEALLDKGAGETDPEKRAEYYKEAQVYLIDDMPAINVLAWAGYTASRSDLYNLPIDGAGKWGWNEYTFTYYIDE